MYGKSFADSAVSAAGQIRKKAVFCVDNVKATCTIDQMKSFISLNMGVKLYPVSKYNLDVKGTRMRTGLSERRSASAFMTMTVKDSWMLMPGQSLLSSLNGTLNNKQIVQISRGTRDVVSATAVMSRWMFKHMLIRPPAVLHHQLKLSIC